MADRRTSIVQCLYTPDVLPWVERFYSDLRTVRNGASEGRDDVLN
jgi:hypothetical protein